MKFIAKCLATVLISIGFSGAAAETPATITNNSPSVFWVSDPVLPGEVVLVEGANWGAQPRVELSWLQDGKAAAAEPDKAVMRKSVVVTPLQTTASSLKFLVPGDWKEGLYSFTVESAGVKTAPFVLNAPDPWWQQGDWGKEASPGGWLRVFGKCLSIQKQASVSLRSAEKIILLNPSQQDMWSLTVALPENLSPGEYQTWVHNGCGGSAGWRKVGSIEIKPHPPVWKADVFDVRDYGAAGNDAFEDTAAIQAALDAAGKNGGGIVNIPRGRFQINATLVVPRFILLRGAGAELTQLYWRDRVEPLDTLIKGTNSFGTEDLSIMATNHIGGLVADAGEKPDAGNVFFRRLHLRLNRFEQVQADEAGRRLLPMGGQGTHGSYAIFAGGENVQVTDCEIYSSRSPFGFNGLRHGLIRNNRCFQGDTAHGLGGEDVIFEDNIVEGGPVARGGYEYVERNLYFARNRIGAMSLADSELFTTDGGNTEVVKLTAGDGTKLTLANDVNWKTWTRGDTRKLALFIIGGTGAGQYRGIVSYKGREVEMDRLWAVPPDETSTVVLCPYFTHGLLLGNEFHDGGIVQNFCWGMEWIFAGNRVTRGGGIHNAGRGKIPNWYSQYFENEIMEGSGFRGPWNEQPPADSHLQVIGDGARGAVFRRNILHNNALIDVTQVVHDVVIDNNTVRNADVGISVDPRSDGIMLWNNRFEKVTQPLRIGDKVFMHPAERLLNRLSGDGLVPVKLQADPAWKGALQRLEKLQTQDPGSAALAAELQGCLSELAKAAGTALPNGQSLEFLQALTGLTLEEASSPELQAILSNSAGGAAETSFLLSLPAWSIPLTLTLSLPSLKGWQLDGVQALALKPGGNGTVKANLTLPAGVWGRPTIPLLCKAAGAGWDMGVSGRLQLGNRSKVAPDMVSQWMAVGPFESDRPGVMGDTVYPPERRLDLAAEYPGTEGKVRWQPIKITTPYLDFTQLYGSKEKGVAYAVAVLRVAKPTTVIITTNGGSTYTSGVTYLNGQLLGVPFRYGSNKVSRTLPVGDNVLLCGMAQKGKTWQLSVQVEANTSASPGDLQLLPVDQLGKVAAV
ncbi:MAG: glycosyl hydrolase family 28-related protein, partial [Victivallales bacterium]